MSQEGTANIPPTHPTYRDDFRREAVNLLLSSGHPLKRVAEGLGMLRNIVEAVERASDTFRHVGFIQGGKAYGAQFGMYRTPFGEGEHRG